ncbi:DEAD/DEAH box helicase family protein [Streptomyces sp. NPDC045456]|uniref:DEAD/DEAH box helicase n=1 Tax=Streptomyces sp. NPDC045456 TaxID=3155254 RepID=UPI0033CC5E94
MVMNPRPHQLAALEAIRNIGPTGRALAVMACGTGKTLVGQVAALERVGTTGSVMLLVPSKELLRQTYDNWQQQTPMDGLLVYSDTAVGGALATTEPGRIAHFLSRKSNQVKLLLCTYQSATKVAEAYTQHPALPPLDVMVLDEAHRTAGPAGRAFSVVLDNARIPALTRISLTATAKIHPSGDGTQDVISMDNPELYGERVYELNFGDAIRQKLLADFIVSVVLVTDDDVRRGLLDQQTTPRGSELTVSQIAAQIAVGRVIEEHGARRIVAFHSGRERSRAFTDTVRRTAARVTDVPVEALHIDGTSSVEARKQALDRLACPLGNGATVLSNVHVLTEGVDVPAVDTVVFADPKTSKTAIVQAVGRALRLHPEKEKPAVIVLPVYLAPGENPEQVLAASEFRHVWAVLTSLRDFDERMDSAFSMARQAFGEQESDGQEPAVRLPNAVEILGAETYLNGRLHEALKLHMLKGATESWLERFGKLKAYMTFTGEMPKTTYVTPQGDAIGSFVATQLSNYNKGTLLPSRRQLLEGLPGWCWRRRKAFDSYDEAALLEVVDDWNRILRDAYASDDEKRDRLIEAAYRCAAVIPQFNYPASKYKGFINASINAMNGLYDRIERQRAADPAAQTLEGATGDSSSG